MTRGLPQIRRVHARNYIHEEANARLSESIAPYQQQGLNALGVDSYDVRLFLKKPSPTGCTCREVQQVVEDIGNAATVVPQRSGISETHEIVVDWRRPLFGEPNEASFVEEDEGSADEFDFDDEQPVSHSNQVFESSAECGICYRTGYVPGFIEYGKHRVVLTTHDVVGYSGVSINRARAPHVFERLTNTGYVEFELQVPKYFVSVRQSVRNNTSILEEIVETDVGPLTLAYLKQSAGKTVRLRVSADEFTHVVLTFDLGTDLIRANIAQMSKQTDWTMFSTIGNLNVILPMTIPDIPTGSIIFVPKTALSLIVVDVTYLKPEDGRNLDWSVNTRVCQPQEPALRIARNLPVL